MNGGSSPDGGEIFGGYKVFQKRYSGGRRQIIATAHLIGHAACMNDW